MELNVDEMSKAEKKDLVASLTQQMQQAAKELDFENAANLRDMIMELKTEVD